MKNSWGTDNCAAMKAHYAVYSIRQAAALWCEVPENQIHTVLQGAKQLSSTGFGRSIWTHHDVPCLEPRSRAIAEAIADGSLPHGREDGETVDSSDHVAYERRHFFGRDLRKWMEKEFPNEKPAFLFDDIERNTHSAISADSYRALKADRDTLQKRIDKATDVYKILRQDKDSIERERDSLKAMVDKYSAASNQADTPKTKPPNLLKSQYWDTLKNLVDRSISEFPSWRDTQRRVQKTGNLQEWLTQTIGADNREAEILKKVLSDLFKELR